MENKKLYYAYSDYLKKTYGEKVYKLPVNLPVGCPNRINGLSGCAFCSEQGTGFEAEDADVPVTEQLARNREHIERKYHVHKFIAYFQNFTNTFLPLEIFQQYIEEAAKVKDIVEIQISTRPDCIREDYLDYLDTVESRYPVQIGIELGLQTVNYHTLQSMNRGHRLAEFIDAVRRIEKHRFPVCAHVILNLPGDDMTDSIETARILSALEISMVKIHSLYIAKNTVLCKSYENGTISVCSKEEYLERLAAFLKNLSPDIVVERLFSRIPEEEAVFSNWGTSWWKLKDEFEQKMIEEGAYQGCAFHYLNGAALKYL